MQILMEKIALFNKFPYYLIVKKNKFRDDPLEIGVVNKKNISFKKNHYQINTTIHNISWTYVAQK